MDERRPEPLNESEQIFKQMYENHPDLHLDRPRTLEELERLTSCLPEHRMLCALSGSYPESPTLPETYFPKSADVIANHHPRYSPCFFHSHDFFEISYVVTGHYDNFLSGQRLQLKAGDLSLMALRTPHAVSVFNDETIVINLMLRASTFRQTFFGILSYQDVISSFFSRALYTPGAESYLLFRTDGDPVIRELILRIQDEIRECRSYAERMVNTLMTELFIQLLRRHQQHLTVSNPSGRNADNNILLIMNYMMKNYKELSLKGLSSFFGYSERQMTRILKDYTGKNFTSILQDIRVQQACELLRNPDIPVPEVIDAVGYSNLSHFYTVFKRQYGMTPAAYREKILSEKESEERP